MIFKWTPRRSLSMVEVVLSVALFLVVVAGFSAMSSIAIRATKTSKARYIAQETAGRIAEFVRSRGAIGATTVGNIPEVFNDRGTTATIGGVDWLVPRSCDGADGDDKLQATLLDPTSGGLHYQTPPPISGTAYSAYTGMFDRLVGYPVDPTVVFADPNDPTDGYDPHADPDYAGSIVQALFEGEVRRPTDHAALVRVRFLNEREYQQMWGLNAADLNLYDLNFDGVVDPDNTTVVNPLSNHNVANWNRYAMMPMLVEVRWRESDNQDRIYQLTTVAVQAPRAIDALPGLSSGNGS